MSNERDVHARKILLLFLAVPGPLRSIHVQGANAGVGARRFIPMVLPYTLGGMVVKKNDRNKFP